ncbi:Fungalysin metallopeptidase-domain-containing protein [Auriculariales sp. MPI-PUGE-AT-0066]|nr:Fungalysin metallopeptidase-domain-containing protein [Auriculariales sp. MPI-PUGE-AT-0066]
MASALLALLLLSFHLASALPTTPAHHEHATHRTRTLPSRRTIKTYHPKSKFEVYSRGLARRDLSSKFDPSKYRDAGLKFVKSKFGSAEGEQDMEIVSAYDELHVSHVWIRQRVAGLPVGNTLANVVQNNKGDVLSYSSNFVSPRQGNSFHYTRGAATHAVQTLGGRHDPNHPSTLEFYVIEGGDLQLTHSVRMHLEDGHIVKAFVDAEDGKVHGIIDYTSHLSARVVRSPNKTVSPHGWTFAEGGKVPAGHTLGNNAWAASLDISVNDATAKNDVIKAATKFTSPDTFDYTPDLEQEPTVQQNRDAAVVNVWYLNNMAHDILYRYGFTEKSFNFQFENPDGSGKGNDPVIVSVQDVSDKNNAQFSTMPERDSGFDNAVILHEYAHGLTNRMTGGGTAECLQTTESGGLGEGWSDAFANWIWQSTSTHFHDFTVGGFSSGNETGTFRGFPYSIDKRVNPLTYADAKKRDEVHDIGEIWAQTLHNVHANLVREFGATLDALTNPDSEGAHSVFMRLFVDALAIQPCNPTFVDARDAIIQADQNRYDGKHKCALWLGFALTGLGEGAENFVNSHAIPKDCAPALPH